MFARKFANTVSDTTFQLLKDIILRHGWHEHFKINEQKMIIKCVYNSNYLKGMGLDDVHKLTSLPAYTDVWIEEPLSKTRNSGEDVSEAQFMELIRRLRGTKDYKVHFHLTFNPISILSWIYNLFFNEDKESQGYSSRSESFRERLYVVKTTYVDNYFIDQSEYEASLNLNDPYDYAIFALGEWGLPKAGNPAFWNFNYTKHIGNCREIDYNLPIYLTFDQNIGIMATLVIQWSRERKKIWVRQEFTKSQDNVVLKNKIKETEFYKNKKDAIYLTGDASGKNGHHMSTESFYQYISRELGVDKMKIVHLNSNLEHFDSLNNINRAFSEYDVLIDKSCIGLISDMQATNKTSENKIDKKKHDPHFGDSKRYFIDSVVFRKEKQGWGMS
jgi:PBSX family phage terminase large subunit